MQQTWHAHEPDQLVHTQQPQQLQFVSTSNSSQSKDVMQGDCGIRKAQSHACHHHGNTWHCQRLLQESKVAVHTHRQHAFAVQHSNHMHAFRGMMQFHVEKQPPPTLAIRAMRATLNSVMKPSVL